MKNGAQIRPVFNQFRDENSPFDLWRETTDRLRYRKVEAAESVLHLFDRFYTYDYGSKKAAAFGLRTYVLTDIPMAYDLHNQLAKK